MCVRECVWLWLCLCLCLCLCLWSRAIRIACMTDETRCSQVLVLELWIQHCMWICHCACGSKLLPSLVERLKRVQGQADCGSSDELADNVVDLCMHSTQCRGFPCGGDVLALFAWLGTRLQEGEVPLPHAG